MDQQFAARCAIRPWSRVDDHKRRRSRECSGCPTMIVIPAGRFNMGSSKEDTAARANERPRHEVTIAGPIAVSKLEATFDEWDACAAAGACPRVRDGWGRRQMPIINVSWNDAKAIRRLALAGHGQALPASDQGGMGVRPARRLGRSQPLGRQSRRGRSELRRLWKPVGDLRQTAPVGSFKPNVFGLYDMQGNVWEWVEDTWHDNHDATSRAGRDGFKAIRTTGSSGAVPGATILRSFAPPSETSATSMLGSTPSASGWPER